MKILFITNNLHGNDGWSRYARELATAVQEEGVEVLCLVNELSENISVRQIKCLGDPLRYVANPVFSWITALAVNKIIRKFSPDIIQFIVEPYGTMIPFLHKSKVVLNAHSTYAYIPILVSKQKRFLSNFITRKTYSNVDSVVCISHYTKEHLVRHMKSVGAESLIEGKIRIVPGAVASSHLEELKLHGFSDENYILCVGAVKPRKGIKESIDALAKVKIPFSYHIVGGYSESDAYVATLRRVISDYGLDNKVILEGQLSEAELRVVYEKADLYLMLSTNNGADFEGYGLVYLEANARGIPCIGPSDSGVADAIVDGKTGFLVNQYDSQSVAKKIEYALTEHPINPNDCIAWAKNHSAQNQAKIMLGIYNDLLSK